MFHQISKHLEVVYKNSAATRFFNLPLSVWISDETHLLVFDILHQLYEGLQNLQNSASTLTMVTYLATEVNQNFSQPIYKNTEGLISDLQTIIKHYITLNNKSATAVFWHKNISKCSNREMPHNIGRQIYDFSYNRLVFPTISHFWVLSSAS